MGRAPCCSKVGLNRGPWTPEEDSLLSKYIEAHGEGNWRALPKAAGLLRCGKSCRLRWVNYLRPNVKRGNITEDEEDLIIMLHALLGNRWSLIAARMPGRTDNEIKNYWNTHLSKKLANKGLDPKTHKPIKNISTTASKKEPLSSGGAPAAAAAPSSSSSSCEEKQEAWETTMDLDTSSYSTGTHFLGESTDVPANTTKYKYNNNNNNTNTNTNTNKRKSLVPSEAEATATAELPPAKVTKIQPVLNHLKIYKQSSFSSCASPSSVLQFSSPTASCSDSQSQQTTHSNSSSSCLTSKSSEREVHHRHDGKPQQQQQQQPEAQLNSLFGAEPSSAAEASDVAMLQFADFEEFLCSPKGPSSVAEEFGSGTEFWESLARIEPETSDLWGVFEEGGIVTPPGVSSLLRSASSANCSSPAAAVQNFSSFPGLQENISELLFC